MADSNKTISGPDRKKTVDGRFDALMQAAVDGIVLIDSQGIIEEFSRAACKLFGYEREEMLGRNIKVLMPEPYRAEHDQYISNYLNSGQPKIIGIGREVEAKRKDGSVFPVDLAVGEVKEGANIRFVGIIRDISARKAAELEMREQRERLAHVTRLSTMGEMAAGIAHEVNQPLTAIATYSNASKRMIKADKPKLQELTELLDKISTQALRAGEVIRRLRSFVKKRSSEYEQVDLNTLVNESATLAEVDARHHKVALRITLADAPLLVLADTVQIQQVLLNLVRNAIEAAVAVTAAEERRVEIVTSGSDQSACVEVLDNGPGLDQEILANLFQPFQTTKETGMGMGLSISRTIVQAHAGVLKYRPGANQGSCFFFELPRIQPEHAQ